MSNFFERFFKESMIGAVLISSTLMLLGILYLVPYLEKQRAKKEAFVQSERLISYIKMFRSYYAKNVLKKVNEQTDLIANFDHKIKEGTIPLPATLVHDLGELFTNKTDIAVQMYSNYPFPNREDRVLDKFQKDALAFAIKNPQKVYSKEEIKDGATIYRSAFPDFLSAPSCVGCHNARPDTPKNDWKLGDIRGVIEVDIPLEISIGSAKDLTYSIIVFILVNFSFLVVYYFIQIKIKNKKLEENFTNSDKILSEYKRAVDLGAIVSKADKKGIVTYVNDAFTDISGYTSKELIGRPHSAVRHPDTPKEVFRELWKKILKKEVWQGDLKNRAKDGSDYYVFATIVPILDEKNEIVEFLAIRYDTTSLHAAIEKAKNAEKAKGRFLANMSHELRTPLNAIIGFSQILQRRNSLEDKDRSYIQKINISGQNLLTLVNSILDFSKMDEGEMDFNPSELNIKNLFSEILIMFETLISEKSIVMEMFECSETQNIYADRQLLKQAFINILSNAIKFSNSDGVIKITYKEEDKKHIFSICDNGQGIKPDEIDTLFTPFKQGENAQKNAATGTGLGLAITHKIITEFHKGSISVESEIDKGTCFYISL